MSKRPVIFISHSSDDKEIAIKFKNDWERAWTEKGKFVSQIDVFVSTHPAAITVGEDWHRKVISTLQKADILVVLLTQNSIDRPWVWFEIGFFWNRKLVGDNIWILPLCSNGITVPSPLNTLQAKSMDNKQEFTMFYTTLSGLITGMLL